MNRLTVLFMATIICFLLCVHEAFADPTKTDNTKTDNSESKVTKFNKAVALPGVPAFTGKNTLIFGRALETKQCMAYIQSFETPEPMENVQRWYASTLKDNKWKIVRSSPQFISARGKNGTYCSVSFRKSLPYQKGARCEFEISYSKYKK